LSLDQPLKISTSMTPVRLRADLLLAALLLLAPCGARPGDRSVVPGLMGYNALPSLPNADPKVEDHFRFEVAMAAQLSDLSRARDASVTPYLGLMAPFFGFAALELDAIPVELWRVSPETQQRLGASRARGTARGDIRFGARFTLLDERKLLPAIGLRFVTKTTTGKSFEDKRFTDAPAYVLDALLGKTLPISLGPFQHVRVLAKAGFTAWQQGSDWQDDAVDLGATLRLRTSRGTFFDLEWRGYWGYERFDRPSLVGVTLGHPMASTVDLAGTINRGLTGDAPPWELRLGMIVHFDIGTAARARSPRDFAGKDGTAADTCEKGGEKSADTEG
jgi:hypothetical protein